MTKPLRLNRQTLQLDVPTTYGKRIGFTICHLRRAAPEVMAKGALLAVGHPQRFPWKPERERQAAHA